MWRIRQLTIAGDVAIGVGQEHEGEDGQNRQSHDNLGDHNQQDEAGVAVQGMRRYAQQAPAQCNLIPPAGRTAQLK